MNKPLVSVLMPVFNSEKYVSEAVDSILRQTYQEIELIIVDDGCTDSTMEHVAKCRDSRIIIIQNAKNQGLAGSLNVAIDRSNGALLARMDADDISVPERFQAQVRALEKHPDIDVIGAGLQYFGTSRFRNVFPAEHESCKAKLLFNVCFGHSSLMMRKNIFEKSVNRYNASLMQYSEDYDLYSRLVDQYRFANLQQLLVRYRTFPKKIKDEAEELRRSNSAMVRERMIRQAGIVPSAADLRIHQVACDASIRTSDDELLEIAKWFELLYTKNEHSRYFKEDALKAALAEQFFSKLYHAPQSKKKHLSFKTFSFFRDFQIPVYISLKYGAKRMLSRF